MDVRTAPAPPTAHPFVFSVLYIPFGAVGGFLGTLLFYHLHRAGVTTAELSILVIFGLWPNVLKVFWAPLVDTMLNAKLWYVIGVALLGAGAILVGFLPLGRGALFYLAPIVLVVSLAGTFVGMAADVMMAHLTPPAHHGRAGGWSQAGNVGGASLGGLGLLLANHTSVPIAAVTVAAATIACATPLLFLASESHEHRRPRYTDTLRQVAADVWSVARSRNGLLAMLVLAMPLGTGIASSFFPAIGGEWKASGDLISLVSGAGVLASTPCAVLGGYVCDWMDRKAAYVLFGLASAVVATAMAITPRTPEMFAIAWIAYNGATGLAFAGYAALTLEAIGTGAAATKYNLLASVSNAPLLYVAAIEGPVQTRYGSTAMLLTEAGLAVAAAALYALVAVATRRRPATAAA